MLNNYRHPQTIIDTHKQLSVTISHDQQLLARSTTISNYQQLSTTTSNDQQLSTTTNNDQQLSLIITNHF